MERRQAFVNDPINITVAFPAINRAKGSKNILEWRPAKNLPWYAGRILAVKHKYDLAISPGEQEILDRIIATATPEEVRSLQYQASMDLALSSTWSDPFRKPERWMQRKGRALRAQLPTWKAEAGRLQNPAIQLTKRQAGQIHSIILGYHGDIAKALAPSLPKRRGWPAPKNVERQLHVVPHLANQAPGTRQAIITRDTIIVGYDDPSTPLTILKVSAIALDGADPTLPPHVNVTTLNPEQNQLRLSFSRDPARDTPIVLRKTRSGLIKEILFEENAHHPRHQHQAWSLKVTGHDHPLILTSQAGAAWTVQSRQSKDGRIVNAPYPVILPPAYGRQRGPLPVFRKVNAISFAGRSANPNSPGNVKFSVQPSGYQTEGMLTKIGNWLFPPKWTPDTLSVAWEELTERIEYGLAHAPKRKAFRTGIPELVTAIKEHGLTLRSLYRTNEEIWKTTWAALRGDVTYRVPRDAKTLEINRLMPDVPHWEGQPDPDPELMPRFDYWRFPGTTHLPPLLYWPPGAQYINMLHSEMKT